MKHSVLIRQLKKHGVVLDNLDSNTKKFIESLDVFYHAQDEDKSRLSHLIETVTSENDLLVEDLKKQSAIAINESKMSVLGEMSAGIAHEINNPLMILQTITGIVEEQIEDEIFNKDFLLDQIKTANKTIDRISKIVHSLKTFSRDGKKDLFIECSLSSIIEDTVSLCEDKIKKSKVNLKNNIDQNIKINGRPSELVQVFLNLILNAKDAIEEQSDKWIKIESKIINKDVVISITDSGRGIPLEIQDKLMNPFFTTKPLGKGTGLGLSISKGIIESHLGSLYIDNESQNTCFRIKLPKI